MESHSSALDRSERILLFSKPGLDRGPLLARFAGAARIGCDLGQPDLGPPGAVTWHDATASGWQLKALEGLATLDSARYRLPLCGAVSRLLRRGELADAPCILLEVPVISRGAAFTELPLGLAAISGARRAILLWPLDEPCPLQAALETAGLLVERVDGSEGREAATGRRSRRLRRTERWDAYLSHEQPVWLEDVERRLASEQRPTSREQWIGRQVALRSAQGDSLALAEVRDLRGDPEHPAALLLACPAGAVSHLARVETVLWRDARRDANGLLRTEAYEDTGEPRAREELPYQLRPRAEEVAALGPPTTTRSAGLQVTVVSGAFGDPLVHLRRPKQKRSLLLDLGETQRLPARLAHQVSDVLLSHAHFDHIAGFLWLARSRIGVAARCRVFGPPGIATQLQSMLAGITWNLLTSEESAGPTFDVLELHDRRGLSYRVRAGWTSPQPLGETPIEAGQLHADAELTISATTLDHHIPVLAYRLQARQADGSAGQHLVYATDFGDTPDNRQRLTTFAADAHTLLCEASFIEDDRALAQSTAHLTARACGELAAAVKATQLVPFHFSRRYERVPEQVYAEVLAAFPHTVLPRRIAKLLGQRRRRS